MSSRAALDALQDVTGFLNRTAGPSSQQPAGEVMGAGGNGGVLISPEKAEFYAALIAQLREDGLVDEAKTLATKLHSASSTPTGTTSLYHMYERQKEISRMRAPDAVIKEWICLRPRPLPPVAPQEELLDLRHYPTMGLADKDSDGNDLDEDGMMNDDLADIADRLGAVQNRPPPQFKTRYTAQHKQGVRSVAFSNDGRLCASGSTDTSIKIMDASRMRMFGLVSGSARSLRPLGRDQPQNDELRPVIRTYYDHVGTVSSLAFHPRQPVLYSGSVDKTVKIFDLTRGGVNKKAMASLTDVSPVNVVCPHPCGDFVLVGTQHPAVRMYDINTQQCFVSYQHTTGLVNQHRAAVTDVKAASDGSVFASGSTDGNVLFWDGVSNKVVNRLIGMHNSEPILSLQWSRNCRYVLTAGGDHRIRLWDVRNGRQLLVYADQSKSTHCTALMASFVHHEDFILVASSNSEDADVTMIDSRTGQLVTPRMNLHQGPVRCLATCPADKTFLTGGDDFKVRYVEMSFGALEGADDAGIDEE